MHCSVTQAGAVRVLLLDPHPVFRSGLEQACAGDPRLAILGTYATGSTGLAAIRRYTPDVAVLELDLPDGRGRAILKACQSESLTTRLLVLTARNDGADVYDAIAAGAAGYMLKSAEQDAICESIAAVAAGETVLDAELHRHVAAEIRLHAVRARSEERRVG